MNYLYSFFSLALVCCNDLYAQAQVDSTYMLFNTERTTAHWLQRPMYTTPAIPLLANEDDNITYSLQYKGQREVILSFASEAPRAVMLREFLVTSFVPVRVIPFVLM